MTLELNGKRSGGAILKIFIITTSIIRTMAYPILWLVWPLVPGLKKRWLFEQKNWSDGQSQSFKNDGRKAHLAIEVSSDGELEQVLPIIRTLIHDRKFLEIIYCSPSVEKKIELLCSEYPGHIRAKRMPLVTYFPKTFRVGQNIERWLTAPCLVLVRYDFFPELLAYGTKAGRSLILVNGSLKNKQMRKFPNLFRFLFWRELVQSFDLITVPDNKDKLKFASLGANESIIHVLEFRALQIEDRIKGAEKVLRERLPLTYLTALANHGKEKCLIFGQNYTQDLEIFLQHEFLQYLVQEKIHLAIVPHNLNVENISNMERYIEKTLEKEQLTHVLPFYKIAGVHNSLEFKAPSIALITIKGMLCEFFTRFSACYVGGGFERSIHSVLEPYIAGAKVFCGPKTERSTEFDYIVGQKPESLHVVHNEQELLQALNLNGNILNKEHVSIPAGEHSNALIMGNFLKKLEELC